MTAAAQPEDRIGQYSILQVAPPGQAIRNVGVLLYDPAKEELRCRFIEDWTAVIGEEDAEILAAWSGEFMELAEEMGAKALLNFMEDTLSNVLRITDRQTIPLGDMEATIAELFEKHVVQTE